MSIRDRAVRQLLPTPVNVRHAEYSMLFSADDEPNAPTPWLLDVALEAIGHARKVDVRELSERMGTPPTYVDVWPGEHYKLLAGLTLALQPKVVVEIGTATGISALTVKKFLPPGGKIVTFDVIPWRELKGAHLREEDFADGALVQHTDDLMKMENVRKHEATLREAAFIFIDAAKDGVMEQHFIDNLRQISYAQKPLVMFDDIRVWNMLRIWRELPLPKLDLTSFGHWSGTGLVEWKGR